MSSKVSFVCNEESVALFLSIIEKLQDATGDRKIRIGGSEYSFYHSIDNPNTDIVDFSVNDVCFHDLSSSEQLEYVMARENAIGNLISHRIRDEECSGVVIEESEEEEEVVTSLPEDVDNVTDGNVRDQIFRSCNAEALFTAHDITRGLRNQGFWVEHDHVKRVINEMFANHEMSGYSREVVDLSGHRRDSGSFPPYVYHPDCKDVSEYNHGDYQLN